MKSPVSRKSSLQRLARVVIALAVTSAASLTSVGVAHAEPPDSTDNFYGVTPARFMDTRGGGATIDGLYVGTGAVAAGQTREVLVSNRAPIPSTAAAVALNVTAVGATQSTYVTVWPSGQPKPNASNLNVQPGLTTPNMVIVPVGADNEVSLFNANGSVHLIVDVLGWFPAGENFTGLNPARLLDSRPNGVTIDDISEGVGALGADQTYNLSVIGRGDVPFDGQVGAVALNVTAVAPTMSSFVTVWPAGTPRPTASNLNLRAGVTVPNMVIVPVGANGEVSLYNFKGQTHLIVDVLGWFPVADSFEGLQPARLLDTRATGSTIDGVSQGGGVAGSDSETQVTVAGRGGVPAKDFVGAVALNVTAVSPSQQSFVTAWPTGQPRPNASNLNLQAGVTVPNMVIVPIGADGKISLYNFAGSTHLLVDVLGWFPSNSFPSSDTRVSVSSDGVEGDFGSIQASVSADGRMVAFTSAASNLVADDINGAFDVFVHDRVTGETVRVSVKSDGGQVLGHSSNPQISGNGRFVAFESQSSQLVAGDVNGFTDVFVHDLQEHTTELVSVSSAEAKAVGGHSFDPTINFDGDVVAFTSDAVNLGAALDVLGNSDIFKRSSESGLTIRVSKVGVSGEPSGDSRAPSISDDGTVIAFESEATDLVAGPMLLFSNIYVVKQNVITRISIHTNGATADAASNAPEVSGNGGFVVFQSTATTLVNENNGTFFSDIFVRDLVDDTTVRVNVPVLAAFGNDDSFNASISQDGRYVTFASDASNIVFGDLNASSDVFVADTVADEVTRVTSNGNDDSDAPSISADGRYIAYLSAATNLVQGDGNAVVDIFLHDQGTQPMQFA